MITIKDGNGNNYEFETTKFPDGTSQVWKLTPEPPRMSVMNVTWFFENEGEVFQLCQLATLLYKHFHCFPTLIAPFMPYGRQDKPVRNDTTFARDVLLQVLTNSEFTKIKTYDAHSGSVYIESKEPTELIERALQDGYNVVCFPDKGAKERYSKLIPAGIEVIYGNKRRNQQTGAIEGLEIELNGVDITGKKVLVQDDICDGGRTFIELAETIKNLGQLPKSLGLAVSHGIFSKGLDILYKAGYNSIYTTNSLLENDVDYVLFSDSEFKTIGSLTVIDILGE